MGSTIGSNMAQPEPEHFTACFSNFETIEDFAVFIENFFPKAYGVNGLAWAIENVLVPRDPTTGSFKGFCYIEFNDETSLLEALELDNLAIAGTGARSIVTRVEGEEVCKPDEKAPFEAYVGNGDVHPKEVVIKSVLKCFASYRITSVQFASNTRAEEGDEGYYVSFLNKLTRKQMTKMNYDIVPFPMEVKLTRRFGVSQTDLDEGRTVCCKDCGGVRVVGCGDCGGYRDVQTTIAKQEPPPNEPPFTAYIGNLAQETSTKDIEGFFGKLAVASVQVPRDPKNGRPKSFGFVEFRDYQSLVAALKKDGALMKNRKIKVMVPKVRRQ